jgi:hypothetical protein
MYITSGMSHCMDQTVPVLDKSLADFGYNVCCFVFIFCMSIANLFSGHASRSSLCSVVQSDSQH